MTRPRRSSGRILRANRRPPTQVRAVLFAAILLAVILAVLVWQVVRTFGADAGSKAAWKRVGSCVAEGHAGVVACSGVRLEQIAIPRQIAACSIGGKCVAKVNVEALGPFEAALSEVVARGYGGSVTRFDTVNRRQCRDARKGTWIRGCVSKHSYGIAVDFRAFDDNARWKEVTKAEPDVTEVIKIFRSHGFKWGGTFANFDPQHLEWIPR